MKSCLFAILAIFFFTSFSYANGNLGAYNCQEKNGPVVIQGHLYSDEIGIAAISIVTEDKIKNASVEKVYSVFPIPGQNSISFVDFNETEGYFKSAGFYSSAIVMTQKNIQRLYQNKTYEISVIRNEGGSETKKYTCVRN